MGRPGLRKPGLPDFDDDAVIVGRTGMARFCRYCGTELRENAAFCEGCGKAVPKIEPPKSGTQQPKFCRSCGKALAPGAKFCRSCGGKVGIAVQQAQQAAPAPGGQQAPHTGTQQYTQNAPQGSRPQKTASLPRSLKPLIALVTAAAVFVCFVYPGFVRTKLFGGPETHAVSGGNTGSGSNGGNTGGNGQNGSNGSGISDELEGITLEEVEEVPTIVGNSKAFELNPWQGLQISAEENALDYDREFKVSRLSGRELDSVSETLEEKNGALLMAFDLDAGLKADEYLPGYYNVSVDLSTLGVPEEMYDSMVAFRIDENGEYYEYASEVTDGVLSYKSRQNSIEGVAAIVITLGYTAYTLYYNATEIERYYKGKETGSYHKEGDKFNIIWAKDELGAVDATYEELKEEKLKLLKKANHRFPRPNPDEYENGKDAKGRTYDEAVAERNRQVLTNFCETVKTDTVVQTLESNLRAKKIFPDIIEQVAQSARYAYEFLNSPIYKVRMHSYTINIYLQALNTGADAEQKVVYMRNPYIVVSLGVIFQSNVGDQSAINQDTLPLTLAHEILHACQHEYYTGEVIGRGSNVRLFEAVAAAMEPDAYRYMNEKGYFKVIGGLDLDKPEDWETFLTYAAGRKWEEYLAWDFDQNPSDHLQDSGYLLGYFIEYLNKYYKWHSTNWIMLNYQAFQSFSKTIKKAYGISDFLYPRACEKFLRWMRENRIPIDKYSVTDTKLCDILDLPDLDPKKPVSKYSEPASSPDINYPFLRTHRIHRSDEGVDSYGILTVPYTPEDKSDFLHEYRPRPMASVLKKEEQNKSADLSIAGIIKAGEVLYHDEKPFRTLDYTQLYDLKDIGLGENGVYTYLLLKPAEPEVNVDKELLYVTLRGYPDQLARDARNEEYYLKEMDIGLELKIVRDDEEEFEIEELYPVEDWEKKITLDTGDFTGGYSGEEPVFHAQVREYICIGDEYVYGPWSEIEPDIYGTWEVEADMQEFNMPMLDGLVQQQGQIIGSLGGQASQEALEQEQNYVNQYFQIEGQYAKQVSRGTMVLRPGTKDGLVAAAVKYEEGPVQTFEGPFDKTTMRLTLNPTNTDYAFEGASKERNAENNAYHQKIESGTYNLADFGLAAGMELLISKETDPNDPKHPVLTFAGMTELDNQFVKMKADLRGTKISDETTSLGGN